MDKKRRFQIAGLMVLVGLLLIFSEDFWQGFREGSNGTKPQGDQKTLFPGKKFSSLKNYQGSHYRAKVPDGWQVRETRNGIDILNPQYQGLMGASHALLVGAFGQTSPIQFAQWSIQNMGGQITGILRQQALPQISGPYNTVWQRAAAEFQVQHQGQTLHVFSETSIANGSGQYCAMQLLAMSPENLWTQQAPLLMEIAKSIAITNASSMGGVSDVILPRNNPLDDSAVMGAYQNRQASQDRLSREWQESILGFENVTSRETGQQYQLSHELYDPTVQGYRNPNNPNEILQPDE